MPKPSIYRFRSALAKLEHRASEPMGPERHAAVAAILRPSLDPHETEILLIRRAEHAGDPWSGHMAFPGGRHSPSDRDLLHTAIRETEEEVGLRLTEHANLLGRLAPIDAVARGRRIGLTIAPFVFELQQPAELRLNHEVSETYWAALGPMMTGQRDARHPYVYEGQPLHLPAFDVEGRKVWGLTYQMLRDLFRVVAD